MIGRMQPPRMHWNRVDGWRIDTPVALTDRQLQAAIDFTLKVQADRLRCMMPGDRMDDLKQALAVLREGGLKAVRQNLVMPPEATLYQA